MAEKPSGYKNPPVLSETKSYQQWSKQLNIWQMITDVDKKKIALVVSHIESFREGKGDCIGN